MVMVKNISFKKFMLWFMAMMILGPIAIAQSIGQWKAYTSLNTITNLTLDNDGRIWCATSGGIFAYKDGEISEKLTTVEGMTGLNPTGFIFDKNGNRIFLGYRNGAIDVLDLEDLSFQSLNDIKRAERYTSRTINDFEISGNQLFVATDFGVVQYNLNTFLVKNTYSKLGAFDRDIPVKDLDYSSGKLYCATQQGIAVGDTNKNLSVSGNWNNYDDSNGFVSQPVKAIIFFKEVLYASTDTENYKYDGNSWTQSDQFGSTSITFWSKSESKNFIAGTNGSNLYIMNQSGEMTGLSVPGGEQAISTMVADNAGDIKIWAGTQNQGLLWSSYNNVNFETYIPDGPYLNYFNGLQSDDGVIISSSTIDFPKADPIQSIKGYYVYKDGTWKNFNKNTSSILRKSNYYNSFSSAVTDKYFYFGSWGQGVVRHDRETDSMTVYNAQNSNIRGLEINENYIVASGLATDSDNGAWLTSFRANQPLYYQPDGKNDWQAFNLYQSLSSSDHYYKIYVDQFGEKWITLLSIDGNGRGLLVLDTGDPADAGDDKGVKLTEDYNRGNLPNAKVNAVTEDKNGEIWIGTDRGVARFIAPDRIIDGNSADRRAQWLINADTTAASSFLLRDINATSIAVNSANEKWIGTQNDGVWLVNEEGSKIISHFTTDNSPLLSNNIISLAVNDISGTVFMATDQGLVGYTDVPKGAVQTMKKLNVYPNPYSYSRNDNGIIISDLSEKTTVRIVSMDGTLINKLQARGGRIQWDARDLSGQKVSSGVYFAVAIGDNNDNKGIGKIVIIR